MTPPNPRSLAEIAADLRELFGEELNIEYRGQFGNLIGEVEAVAAESTALRAELAVAVAAAAQLKLELEAERASFSNYRAEIARINQGGV